MPFLSRHVGASISALGALLVLVGALLPTYGSGDYEPIVLPNAPVVLIVLIVAPALLVLGSSIMALFRALPKWLIVLCLAITIPIFLLHLLASALAAGYACFDQCPPGGVHMGTGFWLPLMGFLLSVIGLAIIAAAQRRQLLPHPPVA